MSNVRYRIRIEEGFVGGGFIPSFVTQPRGGGSGGISAGFILWLIGQRKKKKTRKPSMLYLLRLLKLTDLLDLIDGQNF